MRSFASQLAHWPVLHRGWGEGDDDEAIEEDADFFRVRLAVPKGYGTGLSPNGEQPTAPCSAKAADVELGLGDGVAVAGKGTGATAATVGSDLPRPCSPRYCPRASDETLADAYMHTLAPLQTASWPRKVRTAW